MPETVVRLSELENIVALKEAGGDLNTVSHILSKTNQITILSGDDSLTLPMMALGAKGVISTTSNVDPERMARMCNLQNGGKQEEARLVHMELFPVCNAMFIETNPMPAKAALSIMGLIENELRLPLVPVKPDGRGTNPENPGRCLVQIPRCDKVIHRGA